MDCLFYLILGLIYNNELKDVLQKLHYLALWFYIHGRCTKCPHDVTMDVE
jgi:hypothetical protein